MFFFFFQSPPPPTVSNCSLGPRGLINPPPPFQLPPLFPGRVNLLAARLLPILPAASHQAPVLAFFPSLKPRGALTSFLTAAITRANDRKKKGCQKRDGNSGVVYIKVGVGFFASSQRMCLAHLRGGRLRQRHLDHRLPDVCVRAARRHFELGRFVQAGSAGLGENRAVRPHAEDGVAALQRHLFVSHAVIKLHCVGGEREKESIRKSCDRISDFIHLHGSCSPSTHTTEKGVGGIILRHKERVTSKYAFVTCFASGHIKILQ